MISEPRSGTAIELRMRMIVSGGIVSVHHCRLGLVAVGAASVLVMAWRYFARVRVGDPVGNGCARDRYPSQERKQSGENLVRARRDHVDECIPRRRDGTPARVRCPRKRLTSHQRSPARRSSDFLMDPVHRRRRGSCRQSTPAFQPVPESSDAA